MKLTLLKGSFYRSTLPHPTIYKCKIIRDCGTHSQVVSYVGPLHLLPAGWYVLMKRLN